MDDTIKQVGIWIRVSTEDQAKGESPEHHEKRARLYAESKGWAVATIYDLTGVSGKSIIEHPEAKRMLSDIEGGRITALIFSKLARLARNTRELLDISDFFRDADADLVSLHEAIDTSSPAGRLFFTIIAAMAQWEREEISERVAASVPIRAKLGKPTGGQPPFGYHWVDGELIPEPDEAPVRRLMYELFLEHRRKKTVARLLNERGYRTRKGANFTDTTVDRLIRDPTAKGERRANYTKSNGRGKTWELKPESEWVTVPVEPIVSEDLWAQCNAILDKQRKSRRKVAKKPAYLFAGVAYCECGHKMYVPSNTPKYVCYKCRNKIPQDDLEAIFQEELKQLFFSPDEIEALLKKSSDAIVEKEELLSSKISEIDKINREIDFLIELYSKGQLTADGFGERNLPLEKRLAQIKEDIPVLQAEIDFMKIQSISSDQIISEAQDLYASWQNLPFEEKRAIVEAIVDRIDVAKTKVSISLYYQPVLGNEDLKATRPQGFMAATSWKRAG